jgi:hypothetical protein
MDDANGLWTLWQSLVVHYGAVFTRPGWVRFVQWVTGTVLRDEEHTITQSVVAIGIETRWRNVEHSAEYGAWDRGEVERASIRLIEEEQPSAGVRPGVGARRPQGVGVVGGMARHSGGR